VAVQPDSGHGRRSMRPAPPSRRPRASGRLNRAVFWAASKERRDAKARYSAFIAAFSGFQGGSDSTTRPRRWTSTRGMSISTGQTS
jgi:hypothetical protein